MSKYHALPHAVALDARISFFEVASPRRTNMLIQLKTALTVARTRRALSKMNAAELADVGLTADAARREARRSFFDIAPQCMH